MNVLEWVGRHPILTVILLIIVGEYVVGLIRGK